MNGKQLTAHFNEAEFVSKDGRSTPLEALANLRRLCEEVLEPIRAELGCSLFVISGYRSPEHNAAVDGAQHSRHMTGEAADIQPLDFARMSSLRAMVSDMVRDGQLPALGGLGFYPAWIHVDIRPRKADGSIATWTGRGFGAEVTAGA